MPKSLRWTDRSIRTKLLAAFTVLIAGAFAAGIVTWMQNQTIERLNEQTLLTQDTINAANRLLVAKINQEAGMRGYVLTADERFLDPFTTGKASYESTLNDLKRLVGEDEDQQNRLMLIDLNARSWGLELGERQLSLMGNPTTREQARRLEAMGIGKKYMDGIRSGVGDLIAAAEQTLDRHREEQRAAIVTARLSMVAGVAGSIVLAILLCKALTVAVSRPIVRMTRSMTRLAEGDHGVSIEGLGRRDEIGAMAEAVAVFKRHAEEADRLSHEQAAARVEKERRAATVEALVEGFEASVVQVLDTMATAAREFDATAQEMASIAEQTKREALTSSSAAEQTAANVQAVAAAAEQMAGTLNAISGQVTQSNAVADQAVQEARETDETVRGLAEAAQRIGEVVGLINSIASQTNLLALNATIEAARAGEAGRGFAVVANEVKSLANQTARATDQIGEQIAAMQQVTTGAVAAIRSIGRTIGTISEIATGIAGSVEEETVATREIARNVQQAAGSTREVSGTIRAVTEAAGRTGTAAGRVLTAAGDLSGQVECLHGQIGRFLAQIRAA